MFDGFFLVPNSIAVSHVKISSRSFAAGMCSHQIHVRPQSTTDPSKYTKAEIRGTAEEMHGDQDFPVMMDVRQYDLLVTDPCDFPVYGVSLSHGDFPVVTTGFNNKLIWQFKDDLGCPHHLGNSHMSCTVFGSTMYQTRREMDKEPVQNVFLETVFDLTRGTIVLLDLLACGLPVFNGKYPHRNNFCFISVFLETVSF